MKLKQVKADCYQAICLAMLMDGYSKKEVAEQLKIHERTIEFYLNTVK